MRKITENKFLVFFRLFYHQVFDVQIFIRILSVGS